jgi:hypothetical protein
MSDLSIAVFQHAENGLLREASTRVLYKKTNKSEVTVVGWASYSSVLSGAAAAVWAMTAPPPEHI